MAHWTPWDWIAYGCLGIAALGLAVASLAKEYPDMFHWLPGFFSNSRWSFIPAILFVVATLIFIIRLLVPSTQSGTNVVNTPPALQRVIGQTFTAANGAP